MSLTTRQRWATFAVGFAVGCVVVAIVLGKRGLPHPLEMPDPGVIRREVPGALAQWMAEGKPVRGDIVLSESRGAPAPSGVRTRAVVVAGLDPGAYIRIEEQYVPGSPDVVKEWKFMFANRARARLQPHIDTAAMADALRAHGWRFAGGPDKDGWVPIELNAHAAVNVPLALAQLKSWPQWVAEAEPDYLPAPQLMRR